MTERVFVDTNVWIYARDPRQAAKHRIAGDWLQRLWDASSGRTSIQVLSEYFVTATRRLSQPLSEAEAWDDVGAMLAWRPQSIDEALLRAARGVQQRFRLSWWDSLIVAAAQAQQCSILLTEDLQHDQDMSGVRVQNPFLGRVGDTPGVGRRRQSRPSRMRA